MMAPAGSEERRIRTGLITYALQQVGIPRDNPQLKQGIAWLAGNQNKSEGFWQSYSLNKT